LSRILTRASGRRSGVDVIIGFTWPLAGWPVRIIGIAFPLFLLAYFRKSPAVAEGAGYTN
jgi:hypothetical protein